MLYTYDDAQCFNVQDGVLERYSDYKLSLCNIIQEQLASTNHNTPYYKILHEPSVEEGITPYISVAQRIRESFDDVLIIGMGGATLNPNAIISLVQGKSSYPKIHFIDNTDPLYFHRLFCQLNLQRTMCIIISNSGATLETLFLAKESIFRYNQAQINSYKDHFLFIIGTGDSKLRRLASEHELKIYDHVDKINGRYSGFTNITTIAGLIAGINVEDLFVGASSVIKDFWQQKENGVAARAALMLVTYSKPITVNIGYLQCFAPFLEWYSQIISESLGKNGTGFTPIRGIGPNDQHTMLQLYLDGPRDKIFTMFYSAMDKNTAVSDQLLYVNNICFEATVKALQDRELPVRQIILRDLSAKAVGELVAHCMIETVLSALMLQVNPFDQPGVELIKSHAKMIMAR